MSRLLDCEHLRHCSAAPLHPAPHRPFPRPPSSWLRDSSPQSTPATPSSRSSTGGHGSKGRVGLGRRRVKVGSVSPGLIPNGGVMRLSVPARRRLSWICDGDGVERLFSKPLPFLQRCIRKWRFLYHLLPVLLVSTILVRRHSGTLYHK